MIQQTKQNAICIQQRLRPFCISTNVPNYFKVVAMDFIAIFDIPSHVITILMYINLKCL